MHHWVGDRRYSGVQLRFHQRIRDQQYMVDVVHNDLRLPSCTADHRVPIPCTEAYSILKSYLPPCDAKEVQPRARPVYLLYGDHRCLLLHCRVGLLTLHYPIETTRDARGCRLDLDFYLITDFGSKLSERLQLEVDPGCVCPRDRRIPVQLTAQPSVPRRPEQATIYCITPDRLADLHYLLIGCDLPVYWSDHYRHLSYLRTLTTTSVLVIGHRYSHHARFVRLLSKQPRLHATIFSPDVSVVYIDASVHATRIEDWRTYAKKQRCCAIEPYLVPVLQAVVLSYLYR